MGFDQAAIVSKTTNHGYGKCAIGNDLKKEGPQGHSKKYQMTLAVSDDPAGKIFLIFELKAGTSPHGAVTLLLEMIISHIDQGNPRNPRAFVSCNNLGSHKYHLVRYFIATMGHQMICHALCCPRDGPVEYVFNCIQHKLSIWLQTIPSYVMK
jgi:hypothetical protein